MSEKSPEEVWKALEDQALEDELKDIAALSDEALDAELRAAGVDPVELVKDLDAVREKAEAHPLRVVQGGSRRRTVTGLLAVAAAASLATAATWQALVAHREHPNPTPSAPTEPAPRPPEPSPVELAAAARTEGFGACGKGDWVLCKKKLDEAKKLDPAGEVDERVVAARSAIYAFEHPEESMPAKAIPDDDAGGRRR